MGRKGYKMNRSKIDELIELYQLADEQLQEMKTAIDEMTGRLQDIWAEIDIILNRRR